VISLKKLLQDDDARARTLLQIVQLLLEGIGQHAIQGYPDDLAPFRASLQRMTLSLLQDEAGPQLLEEAASVLHSLEAYNRRATRYLNRPAGEWKALAATLSSAVASMAIAGEGHTRRLEEIATAVRQASGADEIHKIRLRLAECLSEIDLAGSPRDVEATPALADGTDPVTGFASRARAETVLAGAWQTEPPSYVAVMVLDRLQIFNMRFGNPVGDEVLRFFSAFLRGQFRAGEQIFRWSASALLALLPRPGRLEMVRNELARMMDARCEHTVQTASRTILLPIAARWTVFPSMAAPRLLIHKIDTFAAQQTRRTPAAEAAAAATARVDAQ
jgi:GGDEF domain-containing protein